MSSQLPFRIGQKIQAKITSRCKTGGHFAVVEREDGDIRLFVTGMKTFDAGDLVEGVFSIPPEGNKNAGKFQLRDASLIGGKK